MSRNDWIRIILSFFLITAVTLLLIIQSSSSMLVRNSIEIDPRELLATPIPGLFELIPRSEYEKRTSSASRSPETIIKEEAPEPVSLEGTETLTEIPVSSYLQFTTLESGSSSVKLTWKDYAEKGSGSIILYAKSVPFLFNQENPFAQARRYSLSIPQQNTAEGAARQYSVSVPLPEAEDNQVYLIRTLNQNGDLDDNREYVYRIGANTQITIDGNFTDWDAIPVLYQDTDEGSEAAAPNWDTMKIARDKSNLYFLISTYKPFILLPKETYSRFLLFIDLDNNNSTGYPLEQEQYHEDEPKRVFGSDLVMTGTTLYTQNREHFYDKELFSSVLVSPDPNQESLQYEFSIPLAVLKQRVKDLSNLRILFYSDEAADAAPEKQDSIIIMIPD